MVPGCRCGVATTTFGRGGVEIKLPAAYDTAGAGGRAGLAQGLEGH
jgi:hypothetical protein